ncbi:MAG: hypothetical protein AAGA67_14820, partial [Cyanobacteria bacterium P01_F01_bin.153]
IPTVVTIPPGIYHGALSFSDEPCVVVNAVIRHGEATEADYDPIKPPVPYDLEAAQHTLDQLKSGAITEAKMVAGA